MGGKTRTVVLCDDVADLRLLVRFALEDGGALEVVGEAEDGAACVATVAALAPDAVVLDLSMPGLDGLEAIPRLRQVAPDVAIVVFSGFGAERMAATALAQGADAYRQKGIALDELRDAVLEAIRARHPNA